MDVEIIAVSPIFDNQVEGSLQDDILGGAEEILDFDEILDDVEITEFF